MPDKNSKNEDRTVSGELTEECNWKFNPALTAHSKTGDVFLDVTDQRVIPVLFIPGIMGSRLKQRGREKKVWDPPTGPEEAIGTLFKYLFKGTKTRVSELNPDRVEVARDMPAEHLSGGYHANAEVLKKRGWGSVWPAGYFRIMEDLEKMLTERKSAEERENDKILHDPNEYGHKKSSSAITLQEYKEKLLKYRFEVWGGGYNWLQSNDKSADDLSKYIDEIIASYPDDVINKAKKILVVTHSMGGLVARAICTKGYAGKILGVVHTVMPATGAPATYKRMRAGFEGVGRMIMGRNAADVTGIMGGAQGALELLPFASYDDGKPWLFFPKEIKEREPTPLALPAGGDPYSSIYQCAEWYGLVPYYYEGFKPSSDDRQSPRDKFNKMIDQVRKFHQQIENSYHPLTLALWGEFTSMKSWGKVVWKHLPYYQDPYYAPFLPSDEHGDDQRGTVTQGDHMADIQKEDCPGDGTVPHLSARHPGKKGTGHFVHDQNAPRYGSKSYEHSACFKEDNMCWSVKHSAARIVLNTLEG